MRLILTLFALLLALPAAAEFRVATYNVASVGADTSAEHEAMEDVIGRINPDIVILQEIATTDETNLNVIATNLSYTDVCIVTSETEIQGSIVNAIMSKFTLTDCTSWVSADLSTDSSAAELNVPFISATAATSADGNVSVIGCHLTSGAADIDEFLRVVQVYRLGQLVNEMPRDQDIVIGCDMNNDLTTRGEGLDAFTSQPSGAPGAFSLGSDLSDIATIFTTSDPWAYLTRPSRGFGFFVGPTPNEIDATLRGTLSSGITHVDYLLFSPGVKRCACTLDGAIYDSAEDNAGWSGPTLTGSALGATISGDASDHLTPFVDVFKAP